ncbi:MAG: hypothetical protein GY947_05650 [Rhodobacteraceae bacterium]|nr:hypothetical protein [Paracoccaceae bacterium]
MINRRNILLVAGALAVSACVPEPLLDASAASGYSIRSVDIDVSAIEGLKGGREITKTPEQIRADIDGTVTHVLQQASAENGRPLKVSIAVDSVALVSPGQALLLGGVSTIRGMLTATDAKTGDVVIPATKVFGTAKGGWAPGGILGAASTKTPENDYKATVVGFANDVKLRLFGAPKT